MKNYIKPDISFQKLDIATTVSAGCEYTPTSGVGECPAEIPGQPGLMLFQEYNGGCMVYSPELEGLICYHVPTADTNIFES